MPSILDVEIKRLNEEINKLAFLSRENKIYKKNPKINSFLKIIDNLHLMVNNRIEDIINELITDVPNKQAIYNIQRLKDQLGNLVSFFYRVIINTKDVPRELYFLCDTLLSYYNIKIEYLIFNSDDIATCSLIELINEIGLEDIFSDLSDENIDFHFIFNIPQYSKRSSSINWIILLHEIAHCIIEIKQIDQLYVPSVSINRALTVVIDHFEGRTQTLDFILLACQRKLIITEHLCDIIVTWSFGPVYGWRFINEIITLDQVLENPKTHPTSDTRIEIISKELSSYQNLTLESEFLIELITEHIAQVEQERETKFELEPEITMAKNRLIQMNTFTLNPDSIKNKINESLWYKSFNKNQFRNYDELLKTLQKGILNGEAFVIDPPVLFYLLTLDFQNIDMVNERIESNSYIKELIADIIRMSYLENYYLVHKD